jgi:Predicted transcriptional regulator
MTNPPTADIYVSHHSERGSLDSGVPSQSYPGCASVSAPREKIHYLRLRQVKDKTGLGKTTIYEYQKRGQFPMRVQITPHRVGWVEEDVEAWCQRRQELSQPLSLKAEIGSESAPISVR